MRDEKASASKLYTLNSQPYTFLTTELSELKTELNRVFLLNPTPLSDTEFHGVVTRSFTELAIPPRLAWRQPVRWTDWPDRNRLDR